ncbi:Protein of unknown function, partial [Cotesia congregata]
YLPGFDDVTLYHNYDRRAAIMLYRKGSSYIVEGNIGGRILRYNNGNDLDDDNSTYVLALMALAKEKGSKNHSYILWKPFLYIMGTIPIYYGNRILDGYVPWIRTLDGSLCCRYDVSLFQVQIFTQLLSKRLMTVLTSTITNFEASWITSNSSPLNK